MWPATAWSDSDWRGMHARGWTVERRLGERQVQARRARDAAASRLRESEHSMALMSPAVMEQRYRDELAARSKGSYTVLAFLFAMPDDPVMRALDKRGEYFDIRSGDTWDLFFPGYFRSGKGEYFEREAGSKPIGRAFTREWYFSPTSFNQLRVHIEHETDGRWHYPGCADLLLINAYVPHQGEANIDWTSIQSATLTGPDAKTHLSTAIEKITGDLEREEEDPAYGISSLVGPAEPTAADGTAKKVMIGAAAGILAAMGKSFLGL